jgi:hemoglobin/transferrin/lactoferrin receptor protein
MHPVSRTAARPLTAPCVRHRVALACLTLIFATAAQAQSGVTTSTTAPAKGVVEAQLRDVIVSGARSARALDEVPAAVDLIQGEDLDAAEVQDIRDLVRDLPNVSVKRAPTRFGGVMGNVGRDGNAGFNIRGLEGNRVLLTVDGIRVPRELVSGVFGSAAFGRDYYDLGLVSRVEILRGANSALYGSDGLAGMVAMFTTEPSDLLQDGKSLAGRVSLSHDTEDRGTRLGLTLAGVASDTMQWLGSVQLGRSHELDNQGANTALNLNRTAPNPQDDQQVAVMGKLVFTPGGGQKHTLTLEHVDKSSAVEVLTGRAAAVTTSTSVADLDGTTDLRRSRLSWDGRFRVGTPWADELRAMVGLQSAESQEVSTETRPLNTSMATRVRDVSYSENTMQAVLQAEKLLPLGSGWSQKLVYGMDLMRSTLDNLVTGVNPPAYETYPLRRFPETVESTAALFVQSEFVSDRWSLIPALRYDRVSLDAKASSLYPLTPASLSADALTPKLGAIWRGGQDWSLFGNLAAGFKAPTPLQLNNYFENLSSPFYGYRSIPNPELKPEKSRTLELGLRGQGERLGWEAVAFTGRYKDFIEDMVTVGGSGTNADPTLYQSVNRQRVSLRGFELKGSLQLTPQTLLRAAYGQTTGTDTSTGQPLNSVNPAKLVLGVDHRVGDWKLGAAVTHTAKKASDDVDTSGTANQFATPAWTTLDLSASWQIRPGLKLSAAIRNLTDRTYWEWTNVRGIAANSTVLDSYTAPGRNFALALSADF